MDYLRKWLHEEGYLKYKEARTLTDETSKLDPENEPYASKYKARDIFKSLKSKLEDFIEDNGSGCGGYGIISENDANFIINDTDTDVEQSVSANYLLSVLNYDLAMNFIECEEVTTGQDYLKKCIELTLPHKSSADYACVIISIYNQLGILWSNRTSFEKALEYLKIAEEVYTQTQHDGYTNPLHFRDIWKNATVKSSTDERKSFFEGLHTLTLYYLAQVYSHLGKTKISAKYCHITLARQMKTKQYEAKDWSLNCATLSQYYVTQDQFPLSRYCLACAELVNKEVFVQLENMEFSEDNEREQTEEKMFKSQADIYRCWAKYGLNLLKESHNIKIKEPTSVTEDTEGLDDPDEDFKKLRFGDLDVSMYEEKITDKLVDDYTSAKLIFTYSLKCLQKAKEFYQLDGYVTDFVEITQDTSQFYKYLSFFDDDFDNRCKMHKRRIDMLNVILLELNPKHYLQICRQLTFEIAETYGEMMELKKASIEENPDKFSVSSVKKINFLLLQSIKFYTGFVDSYKRDDELPSKFEDDDIRGVLLCFFCMARLHSKYFTNDKQTKMQFMLKEKECYEFIVNYCEKHEHIPDVFHEEFEISKEMLGLFNAKMNNALNGL